MIVDKVINNNIISAYDESGKEIVVMGRGLGFGIRPGQPVDEAKIEKIFRIKSEDTAVQLKELLANMPLERVKISTDIISFAKSNLNLKLNQSIYVTLTDHINFAMERFEKGIRLQNALLWEIKRFYPHEFDLGRYALRLIKERLGVELPEDEAGFIALHFVNAEYGTDIKDAFRFPNQLKDILEITSTELGIVLDERTLHYERFVTHLKFLLQRVYRKELLPDEESELAEIMQTKYPREYRCSCKIAEYIENNTECKLSEEEIMYLAIHIKRVTMADD
ncbi:MAG TPA: PRD domain-containing protein [Candidatus Mediterraneibacter colneyensis]|nr:PRD domain-containing protein [Candidatus Mediterraneibacter colneyensis]